MVVAVGAGVGVSGEGASEMIGLEIMNYADVTDGGGGGNGDWYWWTNGG